MWSVQSILSVVKRVYLICAYIHTRHQKITFYLRVIHIYILNVSVCIIHISASPSPVPCLSWRRTLDKTNFPKWNGNLLLLLLLLLLLYQIFVLSLNVYTGGSQQLFQTVPRLFPHLVFPQPLLLCSLLVCCNHITLFHSRLVCLTLSFVELSESGAAVGEGRRIHSRCFSHSGHLCVSHADAHSFTHLPSSPPVSSNPRWLLPKRCRSCCPDTHRSSPWYSPTRARPQPRQSLSGHSLCWASSREEAFPSCHTQASVDWIVWG